jgi:LysR family transcriptional regulator, regulator for bpeEF and oprC
MDKLKSLLIFIRSAQHRSFSEAARQLSMSPSAVSRAVSRLEADLGSRLFQRTTRSLTLTEEGAKFYGRCQQILTELEEAEAEIKQAQSSPTGTLRLNFSIALGKKYIAPKLPDFVAQYPDLKLEVFLSDRLTDLVESGIDATVRVGMGSDSSLILQPLATFSLITCAAPNYLKLAGIPKTPNDLANHLCINFIYPQTGKEFTWKFNQNGQEVAFPISSYLQFDYAEAILEAGVNNGGIIQAPQYIVANAIAHGKLQPILTDYQSQLSTLIAVLYPQKQFLSAKVRVFVEFMTELMTDLKGAGVVN